MDAAGSSKPFETAIALVDDINAVVSTLNAPSLEHPLSDVIDLLGDLIDVLGLVPYIDDAWDLIDVASNVISGLLDAITAFTEVIPGLDVVMDVLDGIVNFIDGLEDTVDGALDAIVAVVNDALPILKDIHTGLSDVQHLIQDMATELPALVNTMKILQALAEIVEAIAPIFKELADGSTVVQRLETVLSAYEAVDAEISKATAPLKDAFDDVQSVLAVLGDVAKEMASFGDGAFAIIEGDLKWVADKVAGAEQSAKSIAESLAPVRWILHVAKSVMEKVIKPILKKIEDITGIGALEQALVDEIKKKLGIAAIESFNDANGTGSSKKTDTFGDNQGAAGSSNANAMKDLWGEVGTALKDYKRGDKGSAVEAAVEALINALTGGKIDLEAMPPVIQKKTVDLYIPEVTQWPAKAELVARAAQLRSGATAKARRPLHVSALLAAANTDPTAQAQGVVQIAQVLTDDLNDAGKPLTDLTAAAAATISAMTTAAPSIAPATSVLSQISSYTAAPPRARVEIGALATIATSINDVVSRLIQLYPSETKTLADVAPAIQDLTTQLTTLAATETKIAKVLTGADAQVIKTLSQINPIAQLPTHANAISAVAASGATVAQLMSMLQALNAALGHAHTSEIAQLQSIVEQGAVAETAKLSDLAQQVTEIDQSLKSIETTGNDVLAFYQGIAQWGAPVSEQWQPMLLDAAKYAKAIDSILTPLSYLLQLGGCAKPQNDELGSIADTIRKDAMEAAAFIRDGAITLMQDILEALPKILQDVTTDALHLPQMEALITQANAALADDLNTLVSATAKIQTALSTIADGTQPLQTYSWTYTDKDGNDHTIKISNAFFSDEAAKTFGTLATNMIQEAVKKGVPLPDASPIVQKWRNAQ
ncbi:hypothetical protein CKO11_15350 [Rhodobacter sp. TJ_12]|nr:hypothetical protein [Rhodobacter sp. TJ_12]